MAESDPGSPCQHSKAVGFNLLFILRSALTSKKKRCRVLITHYSGFPQLKSICDHLLMKMSQ